MSQRSIIEINHDVGVRPEDATIFIACLRQALASGSDRSWEPLMRWGVRRITQCHHTEDRKVVVGTGVLQREYEFG